VKVLFINENTLGHTSYLRPYLAYLQACPELGISPSWLNATPLPPALERRANFSVRGLRKWGLDFHVARWRLAVSRHVAAQLSALRSNQPVHTVVVNTQSVALALTAAARELPVFVCLDATFAQLARSAWFAPNTPSRWFLPLTLAPLRGRERRLFQAAHRLLAWSEPVRESLLGEYGLPPEKVALLPPSVEPPPPRPTLWIPKPRPQLLFVGGDFKRKGGPMVLECYRRHFASAADLHVVTQSAVAPEPGVLVHRSVSAGSPAWRRLWELADLFLFPSALETFGIASLEALAFEVPVVAADVGAARWILADGRAGVLLTHPGADALAAAIRQVLGDPSATQARIQLGREQLRRYFELSANSAHLAGWLRLAVPKGT
jgi:glycosyltransferase involved in cell wall biosynthesis